MAMGRAGQLVRSWRSLDPADPRSAHMLAALTGEDVPARASSGYVRAVFDRFAESFDEKLHSLDYRAPQLVAEAVEAALGTGRGDLEVLDAGCGTGLCGPLLRSYARLLVGSICRPLCCSAPRCEPAMTRSCRRICRLISNRPGISST
jgi:predicted TPR repeat methyltransferase